MPIATSPSAAPAAEPGSAGPAPAPDTARAPGLADPIPPTLGLVLAGGRAQRLGGGDKGFLAVGGRPILARVIARLTPCAAVILNANGDPARFAGLGLTVVADTVPGFAGPLAGVLAGLDWAAAHRADIAHVVTAPADAPFLPADLVVRLHAAARAAGTPIACAASGGRRHPVVALWPVALREALRHALVDEGLHKVGAILDRHGAATADWPAAPVDPFLNVNTSADLNEAERLAAAHPNA
ncbi:molybdenum cofactor guanylyltransferase MobA [Rhodoplanes elegans]|uniref:Molybdenum cofactor guanylyltransferase n=1 Tax=Rhodoplanes elegans TaxID=29408 RepID=A0A327JNN1_9BRAD|nr:molybdenum cofactor guanylyltransferase MobA [Rhodoplanes elegans]MBK5957058.1 molybdenum cofactor guanylyltransferase MobA [Rhodoplanes elegans]RAI27681.1 molybdenum cofactor guanylyltransferase MobA [Rhodoplanes elegans]